MMDLSEELSKIIDIKGLGPDIFDNSIANRKRLISLHKEAEKIAMLIREAIEKGVEETDPSFETTLSYFVETDWSWDFVEVMTKKMTLKVHDRETLISFVEAVDKHSNKCLPSLATKELNRIDLPNETWMSAIKQTNIKSMVMQEFIVGKAIETALEGSQIIPIIECKKYGWAIAKTIDRTRLSNNHLKVVFEATEPRSLERGAIRDLITKNRRKENHNLKT